MMLYGKMGIGMMELQNAMLAVQDNTTVKELTKVMGDDSVSNEKKTSFLLQYLLDQREPLLRFGQTLLIALIVFVIGRKLVKLLLRFTDRWMERRNVEVSVRKFVMSLADVIYNVLLIFVVAGILGVGTSSIVAMVGSAGLAIGLALQGSLANLAGGVLILLLKPFQVGDYIIIAQQNDCAGTVYKMKICYTTLISIDNKHIVIPNGTLSSSIITNVTARDLRKLEIKVGISYDADIKKAKAILEDILHNDEDTRDDEGMVFFVDELGESAVIMGLRVWVATEKYWPARWRLNELIKEAFDANGIEIPYNQLQIHVKKETGK